MKKSPTTFIETAIEAVWLICLYPRPLRLPYEERPGWCKKFNPKKKPCAFCLAIPYGTQCPHVAILTYPANRSRYAKKAIKDRFGGCYMVFKKKELDFEQKVIMMKYNDLKRRIDKEKQIYNASHEE